MKSIIAFLVIAFLAATGAADPINVYIIAGQSNAGSGGSYLELEPQLIPPQSNSYQYRFTTAAGILESSNWESLKYRNGHFGVELSFGQEMGRRAGSPVAIIKVASNGTGLQSHWRPELNTVYPWMMEKVNSSLSQLVDLGYAPSLSAFMWIQGEGDAGSISAANAYDENLLNLVASLRTDLNYPELPFLYNQIHADVARPYASQLRQSQAAAEQLGTNMAMINIDDLGLKSDSVHFSSATYVEVGRRFADILAPSADFNFDNAIDSSDLSLWQSSFGANRVGDGNSDGITDGHDLLQWQRGLGNQGVGSVNVPEPSGLLLLALGVVGLKAHAKHRYQPHRNASRNALFLDR